MPYVASSPADLLAHLEGVAHLDGDRLVIDDEARFRSEAAADLAWTAAFTTDDPTAEAVRWLVWEASQALGARSASIHELYMARARGEVSGFTVPALNMTGWWDMNFIGSPRNFVGMQANGATPESRRGQRLVIGPWPHWVNRQRELSGLDRSNRFNTKARSFEDDTKKTSMLARRPRPAPPPRYARCQHRSLD